MSNLTTSIQLTNHSKQKLSNGYQIPVLGFGTYLIGKDKAADLVYEALSIGYRHIDTAVVYGNEKECAQGVARFLKDNVGKVTREDIWFTTKIPARQHGYENVKKNLEIIANDVKEYIEYVDLVLLHAPKATKDERLGSWKALQEAVDHSNPILNVHSIGVSNYGISHLEEIFNWDGLLVNPVVNQLELHPWLPRLKLRDYLVKKHILAEAYSPLTQGVKLDDPELLELEKMYNIPKSEILLKWSLLQGFIVIVKSENVGRIKKNFEILPQASSDPLGNTSYGKIDLDEDLLDKLSKPESHIVTTWNGVDPTEYSG